MVSNINNVYERAAQNSGLDIGLIKSIGEVVFKHTKQKMIDMEDGSIYLAHVGSFVLKSVKVERQIKRYLSIRAYKCSKDPDYVNKPVPLKIKKLVNVYLKTIIPFKKLKVEISKKQVEFCKKTYESYEDRSNIHPKFD